MEARKEGLSEAAAQGRGAHVLGAILDAQNEMVRGSLSIAQGLHIFWERNWLHRKVTVESLHL